MTPPTTALVDAAKASIAPRPATLGAYAAHPTTRGTNDGVASPDWVGKFAHRLEDRLGGGEVFSNLTNTIKEKSQGRSCSRSGRPTTRSATCRSPSSSTRWALP